MQPCRSFNRNARVCRDGFVQRALCSGNAGCHACGTIAVAAVPDCLKDEVAPHLCTDGGAPLFYRGANR